MKSIVMPEIARLNDEETKQLASEEKETLASTTNEKNSKRKFTAGDMWNRQRSTRSASDMFRRWNLN